MSLSKGVIGLRRAVAASALALLCSAVATAQPISGAPVKPTYAFDMPDGWGATLRVGTEQRFRPVPAENTHEIHITVSASHRDVEAYAAELIADARGRGEVVVDEGATTACDGQPAHRWTASGRTGGFPRVEHVLATAVTGGVGIVTYSRAQSAGDRRDAMASLTSLCPAPFAMPAIAGWTGFPTTPAGIVVLNSPDGTSSFYGSYRRLEHAKFPSHFQDQPGATVLKRWDEPCPEGELVRLNERNGPTIYEVAYGYLRGYAYVFTYKRAAAPEADPAAEDALTAICHTPPAAPLSASSPSVRT